MTFWETLGIAVIPAVIAGLIAYFGNRIDILKYKADSMAERSAKHFLEHSTFTDRSFNTLKKYLGGWDNDEDELRRILVRAGAVRVYRKEKNNEEWWYLLSRAEERLNKIKEKKAKKNK